MKHKDILFIAWGWDYYQFLMHFFETFSLKVLLFRITILSLQQHTHPASLYSSALRVSLFCLFCHVQCLAIR